MAKREFSTFLFLSCFLVCIYCCWSVKPKKQEEIDAEGYLAYCPCMGRFGNQADHFLGVLKFAHSLNRTLILPPWVEYRQGSHKSAQVPFDTYFDVDVVAEYHRVITMGRFMKNLAPSIWPVGKRTVFCYMARDNSDECKAKEGNPFGPFWDTFNIDFDFSEFYGPLHYDSSNVDLKERWNEKYPAGKFPVMAFMGAPASFPVQSENVALHRYLSWSPSIREQRDHFMRTVLPKGPFVGMHLRNGVDWNRTCEHVEQSPNLFAGPQCLGYFNEHGSATLELCFPSRKTIFKEVRNRVKQLKAVAVFVASDNDHMIPELNFALKKLNAKAFKIDSSVTPHVDLAILARSNHFIGNCISTFSAFAKRERDVFGLPSSFWAFPLKTNQASKRVNDEL